MTDHRVDLFDPRTCMLPCGGRLELCRNVRAGGRDAIIMLTARVEDVAAFSASRWGRRLSCQPFNPLRIAGPHQRGARRQAAPAPRAPPGATALAFLGWRIDLSAAGVAAHPAGARVARPSPNSTCLRPFCERPGRVRVARQPSRPHPGRTAGSFERSIDVLVTGSGADRSRSSRTHHDQTVVGWLHVHPRVDP